MLRKKRDTLVLKYIVVKDVLLIRGCVRDSAWQYIHMLLLIAALLEFQTVKFNLPMEHRDRFYLANERN